MGIYKRGETISYESINKCMCIFFRYFIDLSFYVIHVYVTTQLNTIHRPRLINKYCILLRSDSASFYSQPRWVFVNNYVSGVHFFGIQATLDRDSNKFNCVQSETGPLLKMDICLHHKFCNYFLILFKIRTRYIKIIFFDICTNIIFFLN